MAKEKETKLLLKSHHLSVTEARLRILELFLGAGGALSHGEVEKAGGMAFDRVTVYRTLQSFVEKGIIHTIPTSDNSVRYALCRETCNEEHHHDDHVHFVCERCGRIICLDRVSVPAVRLPEGFLPSQTQMIVNGICDLCQEKASASKSRSQAAPSPKTSR